MQILGLLGMFFDAVVVFGTNSILLFRFALAIMCKALSKCLSKWIKVDKWDYYKNHPQDLFFSLLYSNFHLFL